MGGDDVRGFGEIRYCVGAKVQQGAGRCAAREAIEETMRDQPVFAVPPLRPRIGEQDEDGIERESRRQRIEKLPHLGAQEVEVAMRVAVLLSDGAARSLGAVIDAQAELIKMRLCVGLEKMAVPAADLQHAPRAPKRRRTKLRQHLREVGTALSALRLDCGPARAELDVRLASGEVVDPR